jgi:membrane protein required for colicin V production
VGIYDLLVLGLVLITTFLGWRKGLATQVASIVSIVASFAVAVRFREPVAVYIDAAEPWNRFAAMLILYLGTSLVIWLIFRQIRTSIDRWKLGEFDHQMGAVFGTVKGVALASVATLFAFTMLQEAQRQAIIRSQSGVWIARLIRGSTPIMPPEVLQFIGPYLDQLDQGFGDYRANERLAYPAGPGGLAGSRTNPLAGPTAPTDWNWQRNDSSYPPPPSTPPSSPPGYDFRPVPPAVPPADDWRAGTSTSPYR